MYKVSRLCHSQESAVRAEPEGPDSAHPASQHCQALFWLPDIPYSGGCVLQQNANQLISLYIRVYGWWPKLSKADGLYSAKQISESQSRKGMCNATTSVSRLD